MVRITYFTFKYLQSYILANISDFEIKRFGRFGSEDTTTNESSAGEQTWIMNI